MEYIKLGSNSCLVNSNKLTLLTIVYLKWTSRYSRVVQFSSIEGFSSIAHFLVNGRIGHVDQFKQNYIGTRTNERTELLNYNHGFSSFN